MWVRADHITAITKQKVGEKEVTVVITPAQAIATSATVQRVREATELAIQKQP